MTISLGGKQYDRRELNAVEEGFYTNFIYRRLAVSYRIPLAEISLDQTRHAMHDLNAIRYRAWLQLRHNGLTMADVGRMVRDENAIEVFVALWAKPPMVIQGGGEEALAQINARRAEVEKSPLGKKEVELPKQSADV